MRQRRWLGIGVAAALAVTGAIASTAAASVTHAGGIAYVEKSHPDQPNGDKRFHVNCPNGTHVLGGGAKNFASFGGASIQHSYPIDGKDADKKPDDGWEVGLFTGLPDVDWTIFANCAQRHVTYVTKSFKADPMNLTNRIVSCPGDQNIVGGGERASFKLGQNSAFPIPGSWAIFEDNFESDKVPFKGYAICAHFKTDINTGSTTVPNGQASGLSVGCDLNRFLAAGGTSNGGSHASASVKFSYPDGHTVWASATNNFSGGDMSVSVQAVCVKHL
jgi:hypothetical protein